MNRDDYEAFISCLGANERAILEETRRLGMATASMVRHVTKSPNTGAPLEYGLTREYGRLQELGLLREVRVKGGRAKHYEVVPPADVEDAVKLYGTRRKRATKRRPRRQRVADLRVRERGVYSEFYRVHRRVIDLTEYLSQHITRMAFWENAPKDDLAQVAQELADLLEAADQALTCLQQRADDDDLLATIEKLGATNGRTPAEVKTARALAQKLRRQYDQRV